MALLSQHRLGDQSKAHQFGAFPTIAASARRNEIGRPVASTKGKWNAMIFCETLGSKFQPTVCTVPSIKSNTGHPLFQAMFTNRSVSTAILFRIVMFYFLRISFLPRPTTCICLRFVGRTFVVPGPLPFSLILPLVFSTSLRILNFPEPRTLTAFCKILCTIFPLMFASGLPRLGKISHSPSFTYLCPVSRMANGEGFSSRCEFETVLFFVVPLVYPDLLRMRSCIGFNVFLTTCRITERHGVILSQRGHTV